MLQSFTSIQQWDNLGSNPSNVGQEIIILESRSRSHTRKRTPSPRNCSMRRERNIYFSSSSSNRSCDSWGSQINPKHFFSKFERRRNFKRITQGEFRKARPPTFDGESKIDQEAEAWLLGMKKYFRIHDYLGNEKAIIVIYNLNG